MPANLVNLLRHPKRVIYGAQCVEYLSATLWKFFREIFSLFRRTRRIQSQDDNITTRYYFQDTISGWAGITVVPTIPRISSRRPRGVAALMRNIQQNRYPPQRNNSIGFGMILAQITSALPALSPPTITAPGYAGSGYASNALCFVGRILRLLPRNTLNTRKKPGRFKFVFGWGLMACPVCPAPIPRFARPPSPGLPGKAPGRNSPKSKPGINPRTG